MTSKPTDLPWMKWFPGDFLSSSRVQRMTLEEQGAYRRLLDYQWMDGSLPSDMGDIARLLGVPKQRAARLWERVGPCFSPDATSPGRVLNDRLAALRLAAETKQVKLREAGIKGAGHRWSDGHPNGEANGHPIAPECPTQADPNGNLDSESDARKDNNPESQTAAPPAPVSGGFKPRHEATAALADYHARAVRHWKPDARVNPASVKSLRGFDAMLTIDKRDPQQTRTILAWIFRGQPGDYESRGDFDWRPNLLSGDSVRRAWDKLDILFRKALEPADERPPRRF